MAVLFPFVFLPFCFQLFALGMVKSRLLRWLPSAGLELLLLFGMVHHWFSPPSFDILGWEMYLWLMGSVLLGGALAWGVYALYSRKDK